MLLRLHRHGKGQCVAAHIVRESKHGWLNGCVAQLNTRIRGVDGVPDIRGAPGAQWMRRLGSRIEQYHNYLMQCRIDTPGAAAHIRLDSPLT